MYNIAQFNSMIGQDIYIHTYIYNIYYIYDAIKGKVIHSERVVPLNLVPSIRALRDPLSAKYVLVIEQDS